MVESELIIERKSSTEIKSYFVGKQGGQLESTGAINLYLKTHKCFNDLLQSLPDKSRLVACKSRWCLIESVGGFQCSRQKNQYSLTSHRCSVHIQTYGSALSSFQSQQNIPNCSIAYSNHNEEGHEHLLIISFYLFSSILTWFLTLEP